MAEMARVGIPVIVASGRPFSTIPPEVLALDAVRYVITGNGVRIYDKLTGRDIYHCSLQPESLDEILHVAQYYPVGYELFIAGRAISTIRRVLAFWDHRFIISRVHARLLTIWRHLCARIPARSTAWDFPSPIRR